MLIVDGPDAVGKTTLCKKLLSQLNDHVYAHFTRLPDGFDRYWGYVERASPLIVQDRFHMSEIAYSLARGEESRLTPETYRLVDAYLRTVGSFTVLVTADESLVSERWDVSQMYDRELTLRAVRHFVDMKDGAITTRQGAYSMDVDMHVHCTAEAPYADDHQIHLILERYRRRRREIADVTGRRPSRL